MPHQPMRENGCFCTHKIRTPDGLFPTLQFPKSLDTNKSLNGSIYVWCYAFNECRATDAGGSVPKAAPKCQSECWTYTLWAFWHSELSIRAFYTHTPLPASVRGFGRASYRIQENNFISTAILGKTEIKSQVRRKTLWDTEGPQVEKHGSPHGWCPLHTHTLESEWSSFLSFSQSGSLWEVVCWTRKISEPLCLIIQTSSIFNTSPFHPGWEDGMEILGLLIFTWSF